MCLAAVHTPRGSRAGFAARQLSHPQEAPAHQASACPSGPAGDSADTSGPPHAHPGATPDRHVHAGEVSGARTAAIVEVEGRGPCWPRARALVCSDCP